MDHQSQNILIAVLVLAVLAIAAYFGYQRWQKTHSGSSNFYGGNNCPCGCGTTCSCSPSCRCRRGGPCAYK